MEAALGDKYLLLRLGDIADQFPGFIIVDQGAYRHMNFKVFTTLAGHLPALALFAGLSRVSAYMAKIGQCIQVVVTHQVNATAITAVTAIGSAPGNIFFATKMDYAVTAVACNGLDCHFVNKSHDYPNYTVSINAKSAEAQRAQRFCLYFAGRMRHRGIRDQNFPDCVSLHPGYNLDLDITNKILCVLCASVNSALFPIMHLFNKKAPAGGAF